MPGNDGSAVFIPNDNAICLPCKVASVAPPGGDTGIVFISGLLAGMNYDVDQIQHFMQGMCRRHLETYRMMNMADAGGAPLLVKP